jgi:hypothetical protein
MHEDLASSKSLLESIERMNGRDMILILAHLFRKKGKQVHIEDAIHFLSFGCRYGSPSHVRRMFTLALENELISRNGDIISAEFLYNDQLLPPNMTSSISIRVRNSVSPIH